MRELLGMDRGRVLLQVEGGASASALAAGSPVSAGTVLLRLQRADGIVDLGTVPAFSDWPVPEAGPPPDPLAAALGDRLADLPRWLLLPAGHALRRRLPLPSAAADRLHDVLGFEIERQTPFAADAVAFDARVLGRREGDGAIDAELVVVPRAALEPQLAALGPVRPLLAGIDVAAQEGAPLGVNLLPPGLRSRARDPWRAWNLALAAGAILALGLSLWLVLQNRRDAADDFDAAIERQSEAARRAAAQQQELESLIRGQAFLQRLRRDYPTSVEVMDELSRRLPDGTYLEKLAIEGDRLTLIGLSNEAPALIGRLQDSKLWRSPALAGALQSDPATNKDRFTLTAEIGPPPTAQENARDRTRR